MRAGLGPLWIAAAILFVAGQWYTPALAAGVALFMVFLFANR